MLAHEPLLGLGDPALVRPASVAKLAALPVRAGLLAAERLVRRAARAAPSSSLMELSVAALSKSPAGTVTRRGSSSPGRYRSSTATGTADFSTSRASSPRTSISTGPPTRSGCSWMTMRAGASSVMISPLRSLNRTVF
jgi:hypothetical protein